MNVCEVHWELTPNIYDLSDVGIDKYLVKHTTL